MNILVTGGLGYKGHILIPKLLEAGHDVICFDIGWFGCHLEANPRLQIIYGDIRNIDSIPISGVDCVIHLSSIANDPCGDLDPKLTWEISALATMQLADKARRCGVKRFIYASSGSVYGVQEASEVVETLELKPLSEYNKTKMVAERVLLSYQADMVVQIIRPATVCGYSPRMRLDVSVNLLTMQALTTGKITVYGGNQVRPNIHIEDITNVYMHMLNNPEYQGIFNAGFENISILEIAKMVCQHIPAEVVVTESNDPRSYRVNSDKLLATGFLPAKNVNDAILEIAKKYHDHVLEQKDIHHNLKWMQKNSFHQII